MNEEIIQIVMAFFGSLGFAILFNVKKGHIVYAAMNGLLSWIVYLIAFGYLGNVFISSMISSVFAATYGEVLARIRKAPATQFTIIGLIPLVPGASLYYTMIYSVSQNWTKVKHFGQLTVEYALGIAIGISVVWAFENMIRKSGIKTAKRKL
ncbi:MAG: threonine/serine exporter family protein [Lachnospira sp.]